MRRSPRLAVAGLALTVCAACKDTTQPDYRFQIQTHTLGAFTSLATPADSLECSISASLPMTDSIQVPWTGTARVQVRRNRKMPTGYVTVDTAITSATIAVARISGDSLSVSIQGAFSIVFVGKMTGSKYDATGTWHCDDRLPLSRLAPGEATGTWFLSANRPID
jgi:hypothetical protein